MSQREETDQDLRNLGEKKFIQTPVSVQVDSENKRVRQQSKRGVTNQEGGLIISENPSNRASINAEDKNDYISSPIKGRKQPSKNTLGKNILTSSSN